ncbi:MAG: NAD(P)/FAD-dependent oxidoreductase [Clostridia bacterium]|nr:NAD(P)/FAD-dependent oxidoreductase [Clostridia bacterium]
MTSKSALQVIVVGGGASGLLAAGFAAESGAQVTLVERNERPARKVMITGKGRCNLTNDCDVDTLVAHVPQNGRFLYSAFRAFSPRQMMALIEAQGVPLKVERGNRVFPVSDKAVDVVDALTAFARERGVRFVRDRVTELILDSRACRGVRCESGADYPADAVIVCTGGMSYPATGSTGDGYALAQQAGHTIVPPRGSLVPLVSDDAVCAQAQGLSLRNCALTVTDTHTGKTIYTDFGEMLFTHFGVSGPMILSASAHMRGIEEDRYRLSIDLKPALSPEELDRRMVRDFTEYRNLDVQNALTHLLPRSLIAPVLTRAHMAGSTKCHSVTRQQRAALLAVVKGLTVTVRGPRPVEEAIVTSGGVSVKEIEPATMRSKLCRGLFFAGEVLDVDAYTGGFNLQIAFSTGAAAGRHVTDAAD